MERMSFNCTFKLSTENPYGIIAFAILSFFFLFFFIRTKYWSNAIKRFVIRSKQYGIWKTIKELVTNLMRCFDIFLSFRSICDGIEKAFRWIDRLVKIKTLLMTFIANCHYTILDCIWNSSHQKFWKNRTITFDAVNSKQKKELQCWSKWQRKDRNECDIL